MCAAVTYTFQAAVEYIFAHQHCYDRRAKEKGKRALRGCLFSHPRLPAFYQLNIYVGRTCSSGLPVAPLSRASLYGVGRKQTANTLLAQGCPPPPFRECWISIRGTVYTYERNSEFIAGVHDRIIDKGWGVFKRTTACASDLYETNVGLPLKENKWKPEVRSWNTRE